MTPELNWCGWPIGPGESYYGKAEHISKTWGQKRAAKQHYCVVTESHLAEVFGHGARNLTRAEAAKLLEELTGTHRTSCYGALKLDGRFRRHLHTDGTMLFWRSL